MSRPRLKYFIQCDQVRNDNGKFSALGIFDSIFSFLFPATHARFFLLAGFTGDPGTHKLDLQVVGPDGQDLGNSHGTVSITGIDQVSNTVFAFENFPLPAEGRYTISLFLDGDFLTEYYFSARPPVPRREKSPEEIEKLLQQPEIIHSANADVICTRCRATYKFQLHLSPDAPPEQGFMNLPPGDEFACGACGATIPLKQVRQNLENIVGIPRTWLSPQSGGERASQPVPPRPPSPPHPPPAPDHPEEPSA